MAESRSMAFQLFLSAAIASRSSVGSLEADSRYAFLIKGQGGSGLVQVLKGDCQVVCVEWIAGVKRPCA